MSKSTDTPSSSSVGASGAAGAAADSATMRWLRRRDVAPLPGEPPPACSEGLAPMRPRTSAVRPVAVLRKSRVKPALGGLLPLPLPLASVVPLELLVAALPGRSAVQVAAPPPAPRREGGRSVARAGAGRRLPLLRWRAPSGGARACRRELVVLQPRGGEGGQGIMAQLVAQL